MGTTEQITGRQVVMLVIPTIIFTGIMVLPGISAKNAGPDAWISTIIASAGGVWCALAISRLAARYPGMTIMEYSCEILGKWLGKLVGVYLSLFWFVVAGIIVVENTGFISQFSLPKTPGIYTQSALVLLGGMAVWSGIETIARCAEFLVPVTILFIIIVSLFLLPDMKPEYLRPMFGEGVVPVLQGALVPSAWMGEVLVLSFVVPHLDNPQTFRRDLFIGLGIAAMLLTVVTVETLMVNGVLTPRLSYSYYAAAQYVSVGGFIERIDPLVLSLWIFGGFVKVTVWMYVFFMGVSQLFGLKNYRVLVVPLSLIMILGESWFFPSAMAMARWLTYTAPIHDLSAEVFIPTVLVLVDLLRKRRRTAHG